MIFAAGLGTRLQPWTFTKPKALIEYNKTPLLELVILKLKHYGFSEIVINVHHFASQIEEFIAKNRKFGLDIIISDERDLLLDTGGGLKRARTFLESNEPFLIYNVDILSKINLNDFYNFHIQSKSIATLAVQERKTSRSLVFDEENYLCSWKNNSTGEEKIARISEKTKKHFAFDGIHFVNPEIFQLIEEDGVFSIIDLYLRLAKNHKISAFAENTFWLDMGRKKNFEIVF